MMVQRVTTNLTPILHKQWIESGKIRIFLNPQVLFSLLTILVVTSSAAITITEQSSFTKSTNQANSSYIVSPTVVIMENGTNSAHRLYDVTNGPLTCNNVWSWLGNVPKGICHNFHWSDGEFLPEVTCEGVEGFDPIAGTFTTLLHSMSVYQVEATTRTVWINTNGTYQRWNAWCTYRKIYDIRKVDSLSDVPNVPINNYLGVVNFINLALEEKNPARDIFLALVSQGLKHIRLEYGPTNGAQGSMLGITNALLTSDDCFSCPAVFWSVNHGAHIDVVYQYLNGAKRILMEFNSAYISLATFLLRLLKESAFVEELTIHGGEGWDDELVIFAELKSMRSLDLSGNGISSLSDENFARMPNLLNVNLSNNRFSTVPMGLRLLRKLQTLDLSKNPIDPTNLKNLLQLLSNLKVLNLSGIPLLTLDSLTIENTGEMGRKSSKLEKHWFWRLEVLDVSGCNVSSAESGLWATARRLRTLRLADNPLGSVPASLPAQLPALQELDLGGCQLRGPPSLRLAPAPRLRRLVLARNLLATPRGALAPFAAGAGAPERLHVDLSGNPLRGEWEADAFAALGEGASVNLSRTGLTALSPQMLRSLRPLAQVDLGGNPFDCGNCFLLQLQGWLRNRTTPELLSLGRRVPLVCKLPPRVRGRPLLQVEGPSLTECVPERGGWSVGAIGGAVTAAIFLSASLCALLAVRYRLHLIYVLHVVRVNRTIKMRSRDFHEHFDFDAFVCYSKHDRSWVLEELVPQLEEKEQPPYRLCLHERNFPLGSLIMQNIVECMARSRHTLMILTPSFVESQWCQWELEMATHRLLEGAGRDFLVLVELQRLEGRNLPRLLRLLVETRTFLQWPSAGSPGGCAGGDAEEAAWKRLRAALGPPRCVTTAASPHYLVRCERKSRFIASRKHCTQSDQVS